MTNGAGAGWAAASCSRIPAGPRKAAVMSGADPGSAATTVPRLRSARSSQGTSTSAERSRSLFSVRTSAGFSEMVVIADLVGGHGCSGGGPPADRPTARPRSRRDAEQCADVDSSSVVVPDLDWRTGRPPVTGLRSRAVWLEQLAPPLPGLRSAPAWPETRRPALARPRKPLRSEMMNCPARGLVFQRGLVRDRRSYRCGASRVFAGLGADEGRLGSTACGGCPGGLRRGSRGWDRRTGEDVVRVRQVVHRSQSREFCAHPPAHAELSHSTCPPAPPALPAHRRLRCPGMEAARG